MLSTILAAVEGATAASGVSAQWAFFGAGIGAGIAAIGAGLGIGRIASSAIIFRFI